MDLDDFRSILRNSGVDVWTLIDTAISVAALDYRNEIRVRRDAIVERLYAPPPMKTTRNCKLEEDEEEEAPKIIKEESREAEKESRVMVKENNNSNEGKRGSPWTPQSNNNHNEIETEEEEEEEDDDEERGRIYGRRQAIDEEEAKILDIKEQLEDPRQSEEGMVQLLQELADMDITFKALRETDIGRYVNLLRKHPSNEVCRIVKQLVRKWKYLVDAWVKGTSPGEHNADEDSPRQNPLRNTQNGRHQVPDFNYSPSPNPHNGSSGSDKNNSEYEPKRKTSVPSRREPQTRQNHSPQIPNSAAPANRVKEEKSTVIDPDRLASARKRLQNNYQEAQNAKKNRTIQVMDIHDIPKPKNSYFSKNKGGSQGRHW